MPHSAAEGSPSTWRASTGIGAIDEASGTIEVGGGASLHDLMRSIIPAGWFVAVTPGTRYVSVGGAIAADVHGKNHHRDSSFARHVVEMTIATPTGTFTVSPEVDPDLFWATAGGMGLTGVVLSATLRLIPIETSWMLVDSERFTRLDDLMSTMEATDHRYRYSVAWLDCVGHRDGGHRSVLTRGDHAPSAALPDRLRGRSREIPGDPRLRVPRSAPRRPRQPDVRPRVQRGLVPGVVDGARVPAAPRRLLPPARRRGQLEPAVRSRRIRAVPIRRRSPTRRRRRGSRGRHRVVGDTLVPRRLEAVRSRDPRAALLQPGGMDLGARLPARPPGPARRSSTTSTTSLPRQAAASTSPRTPACGRSCCRSCTPGWPR